MHRCYHNKTKKRSSLELLFVYPDPRKYPATKGSQKYIKYLVIKVAKMGTLTLIFKKKPIFCRFWLPFGYPNK